MGDERACGYGRWCRDEGCGEGASEGVLDVGPFECEYEAGAGSGDENETGSELKLEVEQRVARSEFALEFVIETRFELGSAHELIAFEFDVRVITIGIG